MLVIDRLPFIIFCPGQIRYTSWYQITGQYQILTNGLLKKQELEYEFHRNYGISMKFPFMDLKSFKLYF